MKTCQVLIEIWLFEHEFQSTNFGQFRTFWGIKFGIKQFTKSHFQLTSKRKSKLVTFSKKLIRKRQNNYQKNGNRLIIVSSDEFHDQSFVTQAMPIFRSS